MALFAFVTCSNVMECLHSMLLLPITSVGIVPSGISLGFVLFSYILSAIIMDPLS
jgi:hypothetical protein